jgi:hypothetical protein
MRQLTELVKSFFTPNDLFFVRTHNPVPDIKEEDWTLTVEACPVCIYLCMYICT